MAKVKAKPVRLIDMLNLFSEDSIIIVTTNHGRTSYSNYINVIERELNDYLGCEIIAATVNSGVFQIFI